MRSYKRSLVPSVKLNVTFVTCINNITQVGCSLHDMAYDWLLSLVIKYKITSSYFSPSLVQIACGLSLSTKYWRTVYVVWLFLQGAVLEISPQYLMPIFVTFLWLSSYDHSLRKILSYSLMTEQHWPYMAIRRIHLDLHSAGTSKFTGGIRSTSYIVRRQESIQTVSPFCNIDLVLCISGRPTPTCKFLNCSISATLN